MRIEASSGMGRLPRRKSLATMWKSWPRFSISLPSFSITGRMTLSRWALNCSIHASSAAWESGGFTFAES